jgi:hypothetical protein
MAFCSETWDKADLALFWQGRQGNFSADGACHYRFNRIVVTAGLAYAIVNN